jgi:arylsulfatase A-like enzyme
LRAQPARPSLIWVWLEGAETLEGLDKSAVVLPRFYAADPRPEFARKAIATGKFPHAARPGDPSLSSLLNIKEVRGMANAPAAFRSAPDSPAVFTTDHGQGDSWSEASVHLPLAIRYPGLLRPRIASGILMSQVDLLPTLTSLFGLTPPPDLHGRNVAPLLKLQSEEIPDSIYLEGPSFRAVIRGYDKLVTDLKGTPQHLYNLAEDVVEETDLVTESRNRLLRDALTALIQVWMRRTADQIDPSGLKVR